MKLVLAIGSSVCLTVALVGSGPTDVGLAQKLSRTARHFPILGAASLRSDALRKLDGLTSACSAS